jgi:hypothetical protein
MKIGILTQPLENNYGGLLQAYALQKILKDLGHEVWTVDLPFRKTLYLDSRALMGRIVRKYLLRNKDIEIILHEPNKKEKEIIQQHTRKFIEENIVLTDRIVLVEKIDRLKKYQFDAFVVGSDQVWRPMYSPGIPTFFLDFVQNDRNIKRIAYAASFGTDEWEITPKLTEKCAKLAREFDSISVREDSGVMLCKDYLGVTAQHLVDPTLLIKKEDYIRLIENENVPIKEKTIMVYVLDQTNEKKSIIDKVKQYFNLEINSVMPASVFSKESRKKIEQCIYPPVTHWLRGFLDADFVVTDSFHGTVFSIIFEKPFITVVNESRGIARFKSLLKMFDLEHRLISNYEEINSQLLKEKIDYSKINAILKEEQRKSLNFLTKNLIV